MEIQDYEKGQSDLRHVLFFQYDLKNKDIVPRCCVEGIGSFN